MKHTATSTLGERPTQPSSGAPLATRTLGPESLTFDQPPLQTSPAPVRDREALPRRHVGSRLVRRATSESGAVVLIAFALYATVAILLDFKYQILPLDAVSRMANGYYVLWSRDPHLAAVGFVWSPLQSFADIPVLVFKPLF